MTIARRAALGAVTGALLLAAAARPAEGPAELVIDAARVTGPIRRLHGVNGGPLNAGGILDLSPAFRAIAPPLVRLHDCHWPNPDVVDLHVVFPDPTADPDRPESYDFARTDEYVQAITKAGAGIVFRLGESIEHHRVKRHVHPPRDPRRWAAACVGVVRHYREGWAGGPRLPIRYWEIWNEPDNRPAMWTGTDEDYFRLYATTARALKERFPDVLVGGPGLGNTGQLTGERLEPAPFLGRFLDFCRREAVPLDFFSWHAYAADPASLARRARAVRRMLDAAGFPRAESHLNEWNYLPDDDWAPLLAADPVARQRWHDRIGGAEGAAFAAATLLLLQDAPPDAANYFSAEAQGMGLFTCHGVPKKSYHALRAFQALTETPERLAVAGPVTSGLAVGAGVNPARTAVTVLLSKYGGAGRPVTLALTNLPWRGPTRFQIATLDGGHDLDNPQAGRLAPDGRLRLDLRPPAVALVQVRPAGLGE